MTRNADPQTDRRPLGARRPTLTLCATLLALLLTACGGSGGGGGTAPVAADGVLRIVADDTQDFDADAYTATAGDIAVEYRLDGFQEHSLVVEGHEEALRLVVDKGGTESGTITLEPGRYLLYCDIPGHRESGMEARLLVEG